MASRRAFLSRSLGVAVLGGTLPSFLARAADAAALPVLGSTVDPDNVLVVVQMGGGNDGLNTVVPYSDDAYHRVRPRIGVGETEVLRLDGRIGLNPALAGLDDLYKEGHVAIVQGVGYPNPNRSHFEATQIWETASPDHPVQTGWLGRYLETTPAPAGAQATKLFRAVALGDIVPTALLAPGIDVPAIGSLANFGYDSGNDVASKTTAGSIYDGSQVGRSPYLQLVESTARDAMRGGDELRKRLATYSPAAAYPTDPFSRQLRLAAQIVDARIGTRVIFVSIGSFDTHANQRVRQEKLLKNLGDGLRAFQHDLAAHGHAQRVLALTFSEFGRRVNQNASDGTDHGTAMPLFVVGGGVKGGIFGEHPSLTALDGNGDLVHAIDFRAVYATVVEKWLGRTPDGVVAGNFAPLTFV